MIQLSVPPLHLLRVPLIYKGWVQNYLTTVELISTRIICATSRNLGKASHYIHPWIQSPYLVAIHHWFTCTKKGHAGWWIWGEKVKACLFMWRTGWLLWLLFVVSLLLCCLSLFCYARKKFTCPVWFVFRQKCRKKLPSSVNFVHQVGRQTQEGLWSYNAGQWKAAWTKITTSWYGDWDVGDVLEINRGFVYMYPTSVDLITSSGVTRFHLIYDLVDKMVN